MFNCYVYNDASMINRLMGTVALFLAFDCFQMPLDNISVILAFIQRYCRNYGNATLCYPLEICVINFGHMM